MYGPMMMPHAGFNEWLAAFDNTSRHNGLFNTLIILIVIDVVTGVFKSFSVGGLDSTIGRKGGSVHLLTIVLAFVLYPWSIAIGYQWLGDSIVSLWIFFYLSSIVENVGEMGIPLPKFLINKMKKLKNKTDKGDIK